MARLNTDNNYALGPIVPRKADGSITTLDPSVIPTWASSNESVVTVVASADGLSAIATTVAPNQKDADGNDIAERVTVSGDAMPGSGVVNLSGSTEDLFVELGPNSIAATIEVPVGAATPK